MSLTNIQLPAGRIKKPAFLKIKACSREKMHAYEKIRETASRLGIATVCASAMCPNIAECWGGGTATFMIMGGTCTRACRFCNVCHGKPLPLDKDEPRKLADAIGSLGLGYAVITSVDRDDLADLGATHFAQCIRVLRKKIPKLNIEILTPDFCGREEAIKKVVLAKPHVFGHNIETVKRLQKTVRDFRANYEQSLGVLAYVKKIAPKIRTKSSIMVGLGEHPEEVVETLSDLRERNVDFLTIGQYLRPTAWNLPVVEYITPAQFKKYEDVGLELGFQYVASGPFVRSSYKAGELYAKFICQ